MRVISGVHKGRPIKPVPNQLTRPTTDKVKEALFQMIGPYFNGGSCLDLFAGSGSLGIEALSRGMEQAIFVDKQPKAVKIIHENLQLLHLENQSEVFCTDGFRAIKAAAKRGLTFDLIFLDPPYHKISYEKLLDQLAENQLLSEKGIIVCEHDANMSLPSSYISYEKMKSATYANSTTITLFARKEL
ncbi:16S rRNA (guanine(966)-N(2))-methyltransferase RsmD [Radiobacillus sp. PE A8.2]|uniref:16S rRNA (guanine(966)-N(2))-methyltransferase RsmD n=1 Tax=Radiobacillus sp. PE A8.2 TaxID=3380349 RepID=UPI00388FF7A5